MGSKAYNGEYNLATLLHVGVQLSCNGELVGWDCFELVESHSHSFLVIDHFLKHYIFGNSEG